MTTREFIQWAGAHSLALGCLFVVPPLATWVCGRMHGRGNGGNAPWKYAYSVLVYLACVPGLFAAVLTGCALFMSRENLLDVNPLVYFLPVISMIVTLVLLRKNVSFEQVPGFDRLSGLMVMIGCSFALALAVQKTNIWIFFGGSIEKLFLLAAGVFALLKWGTYSLFRRRDEPKKEPPTFDAS
ncbi:MAG: hypothetical protein NTW03_11640 [Verrucomicrobia bacterium]|nr:hypothetical protein [Verrucomicrobiota bacterium]